MQMHTPTAERMMFRFTRDHRVEFFGMNPATGLVCWYLAETE